jgi:DNA-binding response OmpR family regulator
MTTCDKIDTRSRGKQTDMPMSSDCILLSEGDPLLRRSLAFNLVQAGYRVSTAAIAEDALALAMGDTPDLVLLDIGLPGMDGLDALRHFRARMNVPVIFLTARDRRLDEALGLELVADLTADRGGIWDNPAQAIVP